MTDFSEREIKKTDENQIQAINPNDSVNDIRSFDRFIN